MMQGIPCPMFCINDGYDCAHAALITDESFTESNVYCEKFNRRLTYSTEEELEAAQKEVRT